MSDFQRGDLIRVTETATAASKTIWLAEFEEEPGVLYTYHGLDPFAPVVPLSVIEADEGLYVELEKSVKDALPTQPGEYEDVLREQGKLELLELAPDYQFDEDSRKPWVHNEDGSWTAPNGETRPADDAWLLVVNGFEFFPWADAKVK
jgi:hypothetical protein